MKARESHGVGKVTMTAACVSCGRVADFASDSDDDLTELIDRSGWEAIPREGGVENVATTFRCPSCENKRVRET